MPPKAASLTYAEIKVGDTYSFEAQFRPEEIRQFAALSGDFNPLHIDEKYAEKTVFKKNIAHGMLAGSLFSRLIGMHCPGEKALYLSQTLEFKKPIFACDLITVKGCITQKIDSSVMVVIQTEIIVRGEVAIRGEAKAKFLEEKNHE